jgi:quinoprotein glucose dehydrogenase
VAGETSSRTQPFPAAPPPLVRTRLAADEAWGATPEDREWCRRTIAALRNDGLFTPPSVQGSLVIPGNIGGVAWGGMAYDRVNDLIVTSVNDLAAEVRLVPRDKVAEERSAGRLSGEFEFHPQLGTAYGVVRRFLFGPATHLPCTPPPWGTLVAIKAATGEIAWRVPFGKIPWAERFPDAASWGSIALGGPIVTAGGLVLAAGTLDPSIYAFDVSTGKQLWRGTLPTSARATPMTYRGADGRQFVVISAGGHGVEGGMPLGDYVVAYAVPAQRQGSRGHN